MSSVSTPRSTRPPSTPAAKRLSLADVTTKARGLPSRLIIHGVPGIGKTSMPAFAGAPIYIQSRLETGIDSLKDSGLVPEIVGTFPECQTWPQILEAVDLLGKEEHQFKTLVIDTINGCERMCHDFVCDRDYNGRFAAFAAYQSGFKVALGDWRQFLSALDKLRELKRMQVILLAHTKVQNFKNPEGPDYDRYLPDLNPETWSVTHGWADIVLFLNYDTTAQKESGQQKAKGKGGDARLIYTSRTAAFDAKNRSSLPEIISMGVSGKEAWGNFYQAMRESLAPKGGAA